MVYAFVFCSPLISASRLLAVAILSRTSPSSLSSDCAWSRLRSNATYSFCPQRCTFVRRPSLPWPPVIRPALLITEPSSVTVLRRWSMRAPYARARACSSVSTTIEFPTAYLQTHRAHGTREGGRTKEELRQTGLRPLWRQEPFSSAGRQQAYTMAFSIAGS